MILPIPVSRFQSGDFGQTCFPTKVEFFVLRANLGGKSAAALPPDLYKCGGGAQARKAVGGSGGWKRLRYWAPPASSSFAEQRYQ